jgi:hypothetical protein
MSARGGRRNLPGTPTKKEYILPLNLCHNGSFKQVLV